MHPTLRYGLILGLAVAAWTFVMGATGWNLRPDLQYRFWLVVPIQIGILLWSLRGTAPTTGYGRQVWNGVSISLLGSLIIYAASILFTTVVFPRYFQDMEALLRRTLAEAGRSAEQVQAAVAAQAPLQTPRAQAMAGAIGTVMTGFLTSVLAAAWFRKK